MDDVKGNLTPYCSYRDVIFFQRPLAPVKKISARQKLRAQAQKFEYPLIFDNDRYENCPICLGLRYIHVVYLTHMAIISFVYFNFRWKPFRRSAYVPDERPKPISFRDEEPTDKKFFQSLIKPKVFVFSDVN